CTELLLDLPNGGQRLRLGRLRRGLLAARRFALAGQLREVRLGLLEVEAVAGAGLHALLVLLDALSRKREPRIDLGDARARLRDRGARVGGPGGGGGRPTHPLSPGALRPPR